MAPTEAEAADLVLRPGGPADLPDVAACYLAARSAAGAAMPPLVHPPEEVVAWVRGWDVGADEVWVACEPDGTLVGFARLTQTWLDALYVDPAAQRRGIGSALLELVKARRPRGFGLWVFAANRPARAFYLRHGLVEVEWTDGSDNEERAPDVRMSWAPDSAPEPAGDR